MFCIIHVFHLSVVGLLGYILYKLSGIARKCEVMGVNEREIQTEVVIRKVKEKNGEMEKRRGKYVRQTLQRIERLLELVLLEKLKLA